MKRILLIFVILSWFGSLQAQEKDNSEVIGPVKGTITASMIFGKANTSSFGLSMSTPVGSPTYNLSSPSAYNYPTNNSLVNMIGIEGKWFFSNTWALRLNGASMLDATPAYEATPGVTSSVPVAVIPAYNPIAGSANTAVFVNMGVDKYFATKNKHLFVYAAPVINFLYGRATQYELAGIDYSTLQTSTEDPGTTHYLDEFGIGLSGMVGAEYYTQSGIIFGFEMRGISYLYRMRSFLPVEGMIPMMSDNHNVSFLSQPTLKVGFRF